MFAMTRAQLGALDIAQDRYLNGNSTTPTYLKHCEQQKVVPDSVTLPSGTQAHWLGSRSAKKVLLYFHGKLILDQTVR